MSLDIPQESLLHDVAVQEDMEDEIPSTCLLLGMFLDGIDESGEEKIYSYHCVHLTPVDEQINNHVYGYPSPDVVTRTFYTEDGSIISYRSIELYLLPESFNENDPALEVPLPALGIPVYMTPSLQEIISCLLDAGERADRQAILTDVSRLIYQRYIEKT